MNDSCASNEAFGLVSQHLLQSIKVGDIVKAVGVSGSSLEGRFNDALGGTTRTGIRRFQLNRAQRLIPDSDMNLQQFPKLSLHGIDNWSIRRSAP